MNRSLGVFAVVLLFFSLVFAFSALLSPVKPQMILPDCSKEQAQGGQGSKVAGKGTGPAAQCQVTLNIVEQKIAAVEPPFWWVYGEVLVAETLLLLSAAILLVPLIVGRFGSILKRKILLARPVKILAVLGLAVGSFSFAFRAMFDVMGGYNLTGNVLKGSEYLRAYPSVNALGNLAVFSPFLGFCIAVLGLVALRVGRSIGTAVRDGIAFFAAPVLVIFELALWYSAPLDMYWHVTDFAP